MKKYLISAFALLLSAVSFTSCSSDEDEFSEQGYDVLVDGLAYFLNIDDMTATVTARTYPSSYSGHITIPSTITASGRDFTVTRIDGYTFKNCKKLTGITFPTSLQIIGGECFLESGLQSVTIPSNVISVGDYAFAGCESLSNFTIEDSTTPLSIELFVDDNYTPIKNVYVGRNITKNLAWSYISPNLTIGKGVTNIKYIGFDVSGTINCLAVNPPQVEFYTSSNEAIMNTKIYVPAESVELYKEDENWGKFWNIEAIK